MLITREVSDGICTREYFPNRFAMAVRQKERRVIGISFPFWRRLGWLGRWADRYLFCRDLGWSERPAIPPSAATLPKHC
ncbi:MAG: hypothetical protein WCJ64_16395 [Rhodospirillaceae bacterium]